MNKPGTICVLAAVLTFGLALSGIVAPAIAGGDHEEGKLEHVVPLEGKTGINLLLATWYNENRLLFALVTTATMAVLGIVVGQVTESVLKLVGVR
jgi:hypothetical protein